MFVCCFYGITLALTYACIHDKYIYIYIYICIYICIYDYGCACAVKYVKIMVNNTSH